MRLPAPCCIEMGQERSRVHGCVGAVLASHIMYATADVTQDASGVWHTSHAMIVEQVPYAQEAR